MSGQELTRLRVMIDLAAGLTRLCAVYLTTQTERRGPADPVARFHLGNGARLERVNWLGNVAPRGIEESYGIMVNYLYDPEQIEANHEAFVRGAIVRSVAVEALLTTSGRPTAIAQSQSAPHKPRSRKGPNDVIKYRHSQST
jgi:malonyl-CoA decarboxylase